MAPKAAVVPPAKSRKPRLNPRVAALRRALGRAGLDAMVVLDRKNSEYITGGFRASYSLVLVDRSNPPAFITDSRYGEAAARALGEGFQVLVQPTTQVDSFFAELFASRQYKKVGFEGSITFNEAQWLQGRADAKWQKADELLVRLRQIKSEDELATIRKAARLADRMMAGAIGMLEPGITEGEVSRAIRRMAEDFGGEGESFDNIVASGPNSSRPHHHPGKRRLRVGDPVTIDLGGVVDGYCSDLTRTVVLGKLDPEFRRIYEVCLEANQAAIAAARPGITGQQLDAVARQIIKEAGYGDYFGHGLGHGVGLEIHEAPRLSPRAGSYKLQPGNVITIEPGIYLPGRFGVRIEDYAVVTRDGVDVLSRAPKKLRTIK